jgi:hypothetical protein
MRIHHDKSGPEIRAYLLTILKSYQSIVGFGYFADQGAAGLGTGLARHPVSSGGCVNMPTKGLMGEGGGLENGL